MDENPYKAPETEGGGSPPRTKSIWRPLLELVLMILFAIVVTFLVIVAVESRGRRSRRTK